MVSCSSQILCKDLQFNFCKTESLGAVMQDVGSEYTSDGSVDINNQPALKHNTGNWRACFMILGTREQFMQQTNITIKLLLFLSLSYMLVNHLNTY